MEQLLQGSDTFSLYLRDTERWQIFSFTGDSSPRGEDLILALEALKKAAAQTVKPIAVLVAEVRHPNSRMLSAVVGLLTTEKDQPRRVALIAPSQTWMDMLDILGVRSSFLIFESVEEITFED